MLGDSGQIAFRQIAQIARASARRAKFLDHHEPGRMGQGLHDPGTGLEIFPGGGNGRLMDLSSRRLFGYMAKRSLVKL